MGSQLGRMLAITLPLAGIGIAAPFLAPALMGGAAAAGGAAGGATAGGVGGATAGGLGAASTAPSIAATAPTAVGAAGPTAAAGGASGITPAMAAQGVQAGTSLASGMLNQSLNAPQMPTMPTIRAPAQSAAPMFSAGLPSPAGAGLVANIPGPGATSYQGAGVAGDLGSQIANNLFSDQNPFAQYAMAA